MLWRPDSRKSPWGSSLPVYCTDAVSRVVQEGSRSLLRVTWSVIRRARDQITPLPDKPGLVWACRLQKLQIYSGCCLGLPADPLSGPVVSGASGFAGSVSI